MDDDRSSEVLTAFSAPAGDTDPEGKHHQIAIQLAEVGWCVWPDFLAGEKLAALIADSRSHWEDGEMRHAGVGRGSSWQLRPEIRSDHVLWLDEAALSSPQADYLAELERLRLCLNEQMMLGLFSFEGHLTAYPPGAFYRRHLDQFQGARHRIVSAILYLNPDWQADDGGALRLYLDAECTTFRDVLPHAGTLVTFLSDTFFHEVLAARRERLSLTGWFRRRQ